MKHVALLMAVVGLAATGCTQNRVFGPHARRGGADFQIARSQTAPQPSFRPAASQSEDLTVDENIELATYGGNRCRCVDSCCDPCCDDNCCGDCCGDDCCGGCPVDCECGCPDDCYECCGEDCCCDDCCGGCCDGGCCADGCCSVGGQLFVGRLLWWQWLLRLRRTRLRSLPAARRSGSERLLPSLRRIPGSLQLQSQPAERAGGVSVLHGPRPSRLPTEQPTVDRALLRNVKFA